MTKEQTILGIDVCKNWLDYRLSKTSKSLRVRNTKVGHRKLLEICVKKKVTLVVFESTGGYERKLSLALEERKIPYAMENSLKIYHFRRAKGSSGKTDPKDAALICEYGEKMNPAATKLRPEEREQLWSLVSRRAQLVKFLASEKNRGSSPIVSDRSLTSIAEVRIVLQKLIKTHEKEIIELIESVPDFKEDYRILSSFKGVGLILGATIIAILPECGKASRETIGAIVGVAPYDNKSGKIEKASRIHGGRKFVRDTLYMAAITAIRSNPVIKAYYRKLMSRGKPHKVAAIACMRKIIVTLNAMLRNRVEWNDVQFSVPTE